jgi:hypothetical protein
MTDDETKVDELTMRVRAIEYRLGMRPESARDRVKQVEDTQAYNRAAAFMKADPEAARQIGPLIAGIPAFQPAER